MKGKKRRIRRIVKCGRTVIVPMDHGITKPEKGLEDVDRMIEIIDGCADAVVLHKGVAKHSSYIDETDMGLIVHLSASTSLSRDPNDKRIITSVEKAISLGADAVSVHINVGSETDSIQIQEAGRVSEVCDEYGIPLLAMVYPRGAVDVNTETVKHAVRVGYEIGADIVKTSYVKKFDEVVSVCPIPVVIAGGSRLNLRELLERIEHALDCGAIGVAVGRNVFGSAEPRKAVEAIYMVVHEGMEAEEAWRCVCERNLVVGR